MILEPFITSASGSTTPLTASHNRGGLYFRDHVLPADPATAFQVAVRNRFGLLADRWSNVLTPAQRRSWDVYASNVLLAGPLAGRRNVTGQGMYLRSNVPRDPAFVSTIDDAPAIFNLGDFTPIGQPTFTVFFQQMNLFYNNDDDWTLSVESGMNVFMSRGQPLSKRFFNGPYRRAAMLRGHPILKLPVPFPVTPPFFYQRRVRVFVRVQVTREDGRYSVSQQRDFRTP